MTTRAWRWILALAALPVGAAAQDPASRITAGGDGLVALSFPARAGVEICEDGLRMSGDRIRWRRGSERYRERCEEGPVRLEIRLRDGRVSDVDVLRLGERERAEARDLGELSAADAVASLTALARRGGGDAEGVVFPIILADVPDAWQGLLELARDRAVERDVRKQALFWVGQEAADAATGGLADVARDEDEDQGVRDAAVFALSQRDPDESVPVLMEIARTADQAETRRKAFFWLAQMDDPRVVAFFQEVLRGGGGA